MSLEIKDQSLFSGKTVLLFNMPDGAAFSPYASSTLVPNLDSSAARFKEYVDEVVIMTSDTKYVTNAWAVELGIESVQMLSNKDEVFISGAEGYSCYLIEDNTSTYIDSIEVEGGEVEGKEYEFTDKIVSYLSLKECGCVSNCQLP